MIFVIDESGCFKFSNQTNRDVKAIGLVAGIAIPLVKYKDITDYLYARHFNGKTLEKGYQISDDEKVESFIDFLRQNEVLSVFVPADHRQVSLGEAENNQIILCNALESCLKQEHVEYQFLDHSKRDALLKNASSAIDTVKTLHPQEFYNMLMICEVIDNLMRKAFSRFNESDDKDLTGITIIIDTQSVKSTSLLQDFLYCFLFAVSRQNPFNYKGKKFKNSLGRKSYFDATKFNIKIVSDDDETIVFVADYIANFTGKVLRGQIISKTVIDKLSLLYGNKVSFFQFHPTEEYKDVFIPEKVSYAYAQLVRDVFNDKDCLNYFYKPEFDD